ncbi:Stage IV sporulation protein B [Caldisalinibacter kiritimatiensis]|uniref:Stage IV sporulation protein B n=1 Tax=Caldisalinibacter kiritimatiensis TaxID=1304284 RepID=R1CUZ8_9FIRM|nr:Stage IV sporulation protein B [Caldisalinibacter kiritimatiensis]
MGVKLNTKGVLVIALSDIISKDGEKCSPAKNAGIRIGDSIIEINNIKIKNSEQITQILNKTKNEKIEIKIIRNNKEFTTLVKPIKSKQDNCYRLGLWVRDKTAGIGTLTFFHPETRKFGALGHGITDIDTGSLMPSEDGEIMKAKISSIQEGKKGSPGEIVGIFFDSDKAIGKIERNTKYGIYGTAYNLIKNEEINKLIPVGLKNEIHEGKAYILSTIDNEGIKKYEINIDKVQVQNKPSQKSMIIQVVDKELLSKTGGIIQGMSGSPIIQDGKIIGAVTHVFINDPKKGYGLYIEWMLKEAGILQNSDKKFALVE